MNVGNIGAFSAFYRDRYNNVTVPKYNDSIRSTAISNANKLASRSKK